MTTLKYCPNYSKVLIGKHRKSDRAIISYSRCKQWSCEYCKTVNARIWIAKIIEGVKAIGKQWSFITLTAPKWAHRENKTLKLFKTNLDRFFKRLRRMQRDLEYVRVIETHKSGEVHVHILANITFSDWQLKTRKDGSQYGHSKILESHVKGSGFGYIFDVKSIAVDDSHHEGYIATYVVKYITKSFVDSDEQNETKYKRIVTSRGFKNRLEEPNEYAWIAVDIVQKRDWLHFGDLEDVRNKVVIKESYWKFQDYYPVDDL